MEAGNERKRLKFSVTQGDLVLTKNRKEKSVKKATGPANNGPPQRLADQTDNRATPREGQVLEVEDEITEISSYDTAYEDTLDYFRSRVDELSQETSLLIRELKKLATKCMQLNDANAILTDELRQMCGSSEMDILEAMNPENNPHTDEEWSSQSTVITQSESSSQ